MINYTLLYTAAKAGIITEAEGDNTIRQLQRIYYSVNTAPIMTTNTVKLVS